MQPGSTCISDRLVHDCDEGALLRYGAGHIQLHKLKSCSCGAAPQPDAEMLGCLCRTAGQHDAMHQIG
jgi:hypothetical protein